MTSRPYYSARTGLAPERVQFDLATMRDLIHTEVRGFDRKGYFQEWFGYKCSPTVLGVMQRQVTGRADEPASDFAFRQLKKRGIWPLGPKGKYSESDIFDLIEFCYDYASKPTAGADHVGLFGLNECGFHGTAFNSTAGRDEFRVAVNEVLKDYRTGWELSEGGEVLHLPEDGMRELVEADLPTSDEKNVKKRVREAIRKFRTRTATQSDRKDAVRDLGDVLEFLRGEMKKLQMGKDESDLFHILNGFGIRHHDIEQRTNYDEDAFTPAMFYHYLAMIHLVLSLVERKPTASP